MRVSWQVWMELVRAPNLLTAPGDPLAGAFLAAAAMGSAVLGPGTVWAVASAAGLYAGGMILNDVADVETDRRERPQRPLPSGRLPWTAAATAGGILLALGIGLAACAGGAAALVAALLAAVILVYDFGARGPWLGPLLMGGCRGLSVLLGAVACGGFGALGLNSAAPGAALLTAAYILSVSGVARGELEAEPPPPALLAAPVATVALAALFGFAVWLRGAVFQGLESAQAGWVIAAALVVWEAARAGRLARRNLPSGVGGWLGLLPYWQAMWMFLGATHGGVAAGALWLLLPTAHAALRRRAAVT